MKATKEPLTEMQKKEVLRMNNKESNQLTRECLQLALMHLMGEHPYEKITVSEIVRLIKRIAEICEKPELHENPHQWFEDVFRTIREDKETIALFDQAGILKRELFSGRSISELLYPTTDTEIKYIKLATEAAFFQILISWFREGMQESEQRMADICVEMFDNTLKKLS